MRERPIIFGSEMVRAILDGRKTQTRRVIKPQPMHPWRTPSGWQDGDTAMRCPYYGQTGDRLWVRETWQYADWAEDGKPIIGYAADGDEFLCSPSSGWADKLQNIWADLSVADNFKIDGRAADRKWRSPIYMPRWASRITLEIVGVRVERLKEISEDAARAEGVDTEYIPFNHNGRIIQMDIRSPRAHFAKKWDSINAKRGYGWDANPWVWVVEFERVL